MALKSLFTSGVNSGWAEVESKVRVTIKDTLSKNGVSSISIDDLDDLFDVHNQLRLRYAREAGLLNNSGESSPV